VATTNGSSLLRSLAMMRRRDDIGEALPQRGRDKTKTSRPFGFARPAVRASTSRGSEVERHAPWPAQASRSPRAYTTRPPSLRTAAMAAIFLQGAWRDAEQPRGFVRADVPCRKLCGPVAHGGPSVSLPSAADERRRVGITLAKGSSAGGGRRFDWSFCPPFLAKLVPAAGDAGKIAEQENGVGETQRPLFAAQKPQIAAVDEGKRVANQTVRVAADGRTLPLDGRKRRFPRRIEHLSGDIARSSAISPHVESMQELDQSGSLERRKPQGTRRQSGSFAAKAAIESRRGIETQLEGYVDRHDDGKGLGGRGAGEGNMQFACAVADDHVPPIGVGVVSDDPSNIGWLERHVRLKAGRRSGENDRTWRVLRQPYRRSTSGGLVRIGDENATPIGERGSRGPLPGRFRRER
jgi:hypothetical protein